LRRRSWRKGADVSTTISRRLVRSAPPPVASNRNDTGGYPVIASGKYSKPSLSVYQIY
jgi:hypothetical protein